MAVRTRVRQSSRSAQAPVKGWQRHFDGWQPGLLAVFIAGTYVLLGVPRAVPPTDVPDPPVRPDVLAATARADASMARDIAARAERGELDYDVRALGDAVRAFGRAEADADEPALERAHRRIAETVPAALARSDADVRALRAHQTRAFVREMSAFARTAQPSPDLLDLAGSFLDTVVAYGWYDREARRLLPDEGALAAMYKKRWNEITALRGPAFALTLDEERALLRFLLAHPAVALPPLAAGAPVEPPSVRAARLAALMNERRLDKVRELAKIDPEYPAAFAEGVLLYRLGRFEPAAIAFDAHLTAHPDGPLAVRANNHRKAALEAR